MLPKKGDAFISMCSAKEGRDGLMVKLDRHHYSLPFASLGTWDFGSVIQREYKTITLLLPQKKKLFAYH